MNTIHYLNTTGILTFDLRVFYFITKCNVLLAKILKRLTTTLKDAEIPENPAQSRGKTNQL